MSYSTYASPMGEDDPLVVAWKEYRKSDEYVNYLRFEPHREEVDSQMWNTFAAGWDAAMESMNKSKKGADG